MTYFALTAGAATIFATTAIAQDAVLAPAVPVVTQAAEVEDARSVVQLAIALDTSGSMEGLIDSARQKIWAVVNDLALAEPTPELSVALLTYGNDGHDAEGGWVKIETDFTDDLDLISERLFAYTTNGGTELVGRAINAANSLSWVEDLDALKLIVIAGNESADQDRTIDFRDACSKSIGRGIMVNSIYCGNPQDGDAALWQEVAQRADGQYAAIDQNAGTVVVATPYDAELANLSTMLNATYFAYAPEGQTAWANQSAQDDNAATLNSAAVAQRAATKASELYFCSWDLVDACQSGQLEIATIDFAKLPESLQGLDKEALAKFVDETAAERTGIQAKIQAVNEQRNQYVSQEMARLAIDETKSLDFAIRQAIRAQAETRGLAFPEPETPETAATPVESGTQTEAEADGEGEGGSI